MKWFWLFILAQTKYENPFEKMPRKGNSLRKNPKAIGLKYEEGHFSVCLNLKGRP